MCVQSGNTTLPEEGTLVKCSRTSQVFAIIALLFFFFFPPASRRSKSGSMGGEKWMIGGVEIGLRGVKREV